MHVPITILVSHYRLCNTYSLGAKRRQLLGQNVEFMDLIKLRSEKGMKEPRSVKSGSSCCVHVEECRRVGAPIRCVVVRTLFLSSSAMVVSFLKVRES